MAKIKFDKKEFGKYIKLTPENLEKISMFGTPIEEAEDTVEIEIFPNRPDLISLQGFLRAYNKFCGKNVNLNYKIYPSQKDFIVKIDPSVKEVRPYTACAIVKKIKFNDEKIRIIVDLQEKLHATIGRNRKKAAIGIYPLEKIKLPIKYEARYPKDIKFKPLESEREMSANEILQRHPKGKDYAKLLEGKQKYPIFIDSNNKIMSMPPIINSEETGKITERTEEVFIECSGTNFETLKKTLNIIITTLADMGGEIYSMNLLYDKKEITPDLTEEKVKVNLENVNKLLGIKINEQQLQKLLEKMCIKYKNKIAYVPAWRSDILHEVDIIEDIAIAYGYENFVPEIPKVATIGEEDPRSKIKTKLSEILTGLGLIEISTYHLIKKEESMNIPEEEIIEVEDSKTDYKILRPNLLIPILRILSENKDNEYPQKIFEIGKVFTREKEEITEKDKLVVAITPGNYTEIRRILNYFERMIDNKIEIKEEKEKQLIEGRTAAILIQNKKIGYIGEIHPETLREFGIKMPVSLFEISLEEIFNLLK